MALFPKNFYKPEIQEQMAVSEEAATGHLSDNSLSYIASMVAKKILLGNDYYGYARTENYDEAAERYIENKIYSLYDDKRPELANMYNAYILNGGNQDSILGMATTTVGGMMLLNVIINALGLVSRYGNLGSAFYFATAGTLATGYYLTKRQFDREEKASQVFDEVTHALGDMGEDLTNMFNSSKARTDILPKSDKAGLLSKEGEVQGRKLPKIS